MHIVQLLYKKYQKQAHYLSGCEQMNEPIFCDYVREKLNGLERIVIEENDNIGVLYYEQWKEGKIFCSVPVYGYYADNEKMMYRLFQELAKRVVNNLICYFSVNLYSYDSECIQAFHMMQFGNMAEKCIKKIDGTLRNELPEYEIRVLSKSEIEKNWSKIWNLTEYIIRHLQESPIFYPGNEFTEEVYQEFFMSEDTELIAAFHSDELIGMIEWNLDANCLMGGRKSVNVGEIFVLPQYRGTRLSVKLLETAEKRAKEAGYDYMWVEHGTANPNARGFWNKYFATYQYELVREIK